MSLLEEMTQLVSKHVNHYQTDFSVHDIAKLERESKKGTRFYWLLRECGTQLEREDELLVDSDLWNKRVFLEHYADEKSCKLYLVTTSNKPGEPLEGTIKKLPFPSYLENFKTLRTPKQYTIEYKGQTFTREWLLCTPPTVEDILKFLESQHFESVKFKDVVVRFVF